MFQAQGIFEKVMPTKPGLTLLQAPFFCGFRIFGFSFGCKECAFEGIHGLSGVLWRSVQQSLERGAFDSCGIVALGHARVYTPRDKSG